MYPKFYRRYGGATKYNRYQGGQSYGSRYSKYRGANKYGRKSYNKYSYTANRANYKYGRYSKRYGRQSTYRNYSNRINPKLETAKETRIFTLRKDVAPSFEYDKTVNIQESTDWTTIPTTFNGNRKYDLTIGQVFGQKKITEWTGEWRYFEIKAIYVSMELHNCIPVYIHSIQNQKFILTTDNPSMPCVGVFWDCSDMWTANSPQNDVQFYEASNVHFIMRGRPVTMQWHLPKVLQGRKFKLSDWQDMNVLVNERFTTFYGTQDARYNAPGPIYTRLIDQDMFDWQSGVSSKFSVIWKISTYVKLTGSLKYQEGLNASRFSEYLIYILYYYYILFFRVQDEHEHEHETSDDDDSFDVVDRIDNARIDE